MEGFNHMLVLLFFKLKFKVMRFVILQWLVWFHFLD